jgi:hypothetical protein
MCSEGNNPQSQQNPGADAQALSTNQSDGTAVSRPTNQNWDPEQREHHRKERRFWCFYIFFTGGAVIAAIVSAIFAFQALQASQDSASSARHSVEIAQDSENREVRAYVYPTITSRIYSPTNSQWDRWAISLNVANNGKSWARKLIIRKDVVADPLGEPFNTAKLDEKATAPLVLGPGQNLDLQFGVIWRSDLDKIIANHTRYFYLVWLTYEDVLSNPPVTWRTQVSMVSAFDHEGDGHMSLGFTGAHNCADDDCPK